MPATISDYLKRNTPRRGGSKGERTVAYGYLVPIDEWEALLPAFGSTVADSKLGTVYLKDYSQEQAPDDDDFVDLELTYTDSPAASSMSSPQDDDEYWLPDTGTYERPLELAPGYQTRWNYDLYQHEDYDDATPAWWGTTGIDTDRSNGTGVQWKWAKESPGDEWKLKEAKTKPGVESYLAPTFKSVYTFYHATQSSVEAVLQTIATLQTPSETFGYATGNWLVTRIGIDKDGARFKGTVEFTNAIWDTDIYS